MLLKALFLKVKSSVKITLSTEIHTFLAVMGNYKKVHTQLIYIKLGGRVYAWDCLQSSLKISLRSFSADVKR